MTITNTKPRRRAPYIGGNVALGIGALTALAALAALTQMEGVRRMKCTVGQTVTCLAGPNTSPMVEAVIVAVVAPRSCQLSHSLYGAHSPTVAQLLLLFSL